VPIGALATAVLVVNNVRDVDTDRIAGKRTLAVRLGRAGAITEYHLMSLLSYAVPAALVLAGKISPWALLPTLTLPLAVRNNLRLRSQRGVALNLLLKQTAQLLLLYSVLWSVGLWVSAG
jgi:1,4-dihydroxy-2-naphthoate octaprenyltransferase